MFLQVEPPADTLNYMIAGFVVIFGIMLIYLVSLLVRRRNLEQDYQLLMDLEKEQEQHPQDVG